MRLHCITSTTYDCINIKYLICSYDERAGAGRDATAAAAAAAAAAVVFSAADDDVAVIASCSVLVYPLRPLDTVNYRVRSWRTTSCNCCKLLANPNRSFSHRLGSDSLNTSLTQCADKNRLFWASLGPFRFSGCTVALLCKLCSCSAAHKSSSAHAACSFLLDYHKLDSTGYSALPSPPTACSRGSADTHTQTRPPSTKIPYPVR